LPALADQASFVLAALLGAIPSFVVKKFWVFRGVQRPA
jgi:putative flippase GtrA